MFRLEIDRSKWICGSPNLKNQRTVLFNTTAHGQGDTFLLNSLGFMCCLGFRCLAAGLLENNISGIGAPSDVDSDVIDKIGPLIEIIREDVIDDSIFASNAIAINDNIKLTREEREQKLIELAKEYGEEWVFVGEYTT